MSTEELTDDERAEIESNKFARQTQRLLRLYDAALARAEAAESCQRETVAQSRPYILSLQSRLAEAAALNQDSCEKWQAAEALLRDLYAELEDRGGSLTRKTWNRLETYIDALSATPAQAAAPSPVRIHVWCPKCDLKHVDTLDEATGIDWATRPHKTHLCLGCGHLWPTAMAYAQACQRAREALR